SRQRRRSEKDHGGGRQIHQAWLQGNSRSVRHPRDEEHLWSGTRRHVLRTGGKGCSSGKSLVNRTLPELYAPTFCPASQGVWPRYSSVARCTSPSDSD